MCVHLEERFYYKKCSKKLSLSSKIKVSIIVLRRERDLKLLIVGLKMRREIENEIYHFY